MGVSTNGQICYGILFEEGDSFPWDNESDGDIEEWWRKICGFVPPVELFDNSGNYLDNIEPSQIDIDIYFKAQYEFDERYSLPVKLVNYCSGDFPEYIIAIPRTCMTANRGFPEEFDPSILMVTDVEKESLINFCKSYCVSENIDVSEFIPQWYLSSCWC